MNPINTIQSQLNENNDALIRVQYLNYVFQPFDQKI
jgi:hypothetical protein